MQALNSDAALTALHTANEAERQYMAIANDRLDGTLPDVVSEAELMRRYNLKRAELLRLLDRIAAEGWVERSAGTGGGLPILSEALMLTLRPAASV